MSLFRTLTSNYIINVGATSWVLAQLLKTFFTLIFTKKFEPERLFGAGGMPSSHSALTSSIAVAMARKLGASSPEFGLALALAAIVMYDAMGVRRAAGEQARVLNRILFSRPEKPPEQIEQTTENEPNVPNKQLKEYLGHTPLEVLGGFALGVIVSIFMPVT